MSYTRQSTGKVYENWRTASDQYLIANMTALRPMVVGFWMVDEKGTPTRPEPDDIANWHASKVLGLWFQGSKTEVVDKVKYG